MTYNSIQTAQLERALEKYDEKKIVGQTRSPAFDDRLHRRARVRSHVAKHAYHGKYEKRKFGNADFVCNHERRDHACGACVVLLRYDELD